jgi:uncharacterized protein (TIGR02246 family)
LSDEAEQIARAFQRRYETVWNASGAEALGALYTPDAILIAKRVANGRDEIVAALNAMFQRGWTAITTNIVHVRLVAGAVLVVGEFTAFGSGAIEGETLGGKSTHVLTQADGAWLAAMHGIM